MRIHILGICGTFMAGIAVLAKQAGHEVSGSDQHIYPPMSTQLAAQGIKLLDGYEPDHLDPTIDYVIVGNVIRRGNPAMEAVLNQKIPYISGPQWLAEHILKDRWVLAVSGTHGKTTTTSLLTWILEAAGLQPGFLIGGVPENFGISARIGRDPFFVIEADEYDCAFFDKRSKFIHYHPRTLIINNLEFDHADIFPDLAAIKQQFHYLVRTVPGNGRIIHHANEINITDVLQQGCWTPTLSFGGKQGQWQARLIKDDGSCFEVLFDENSIGRVTWSLVGHHNVDNALAAIAAAAHAGVPVLHAIESLSHFKNVKRRLEVIAQSNGIILYDDFAHHPTAIATTLAGLRAKVGAKTRIIAILELGSYTMRSGVHKDALATSLVDADYVVCKQPDVAWDLKAVLADFKQPTLLCSQVDDIVASLVPKLQAGDQVIIMSNSGFGGIHQKLLGALEVMNNKELSS